MEWVHKEHDGYTWYELYFRNHLIATIYHENDGWVWRVEPNRVGIPSHISRENMYYLFPTSAQQICEAYVRKHLVF